MNKKSNMYEDVDFILKQTPTVVPWNTRRSRVSVLRVSTLVFPTATVSQCLFDAVSATENNEFSFHIEDKLHAASALRRVVYTSRYFHGSWTATSHIQTHLQLCCFISHHFWQLSAADYVPRSCSSSSSMQSRLINAFESLLTPSGGPAVLRR